jgi:hypothetical protein
MWTVIAGNVVLDLVALQATRSLLPWILRRPTRRRVALGLASDLAVLVACTLGAAASNFDRLDAYSGRGLGKTAWVRQVLAWIPFAGLRMSAAAAHGVTSITPRMSSDSRPPAASFQPRALAGLRSGAVLAT